MYCASLYSNPYVQCVERVIDDVSSVVSNLRSGVSLVVREQIGKLTQEDLAHPTRFYSVMHLKRALIGGAIYLGSFAFIYLIKPLMSEVCFEDLSLSNQSPLCHKTLICLCFGFMPIPIFAFMTMYQRIRRYLETYNVTIDSLSSGPIDRECILFLRPTQDHNGAFSVGKEREGILKELSLHHRIVNRLVRNVDDINVLFKKYSSNNRKLKYVWLSGHGSSNSVSLSSDWRNSGMLNLKSGAKIQWDLLDPEAVIFLESCSTGKEELKGKPNFADAVKAAVGTRRVIAPTCDSTDAMLRLYDAVAFDLGFENKGTKVTYEPTYELASKKMSEL